MTMRGKTTWVVLCLIFLLSAGLIVAGVILKATDSSSVTAAKAASAQSAVDQPQAEAVATGQTRNFTLYVRDATVTMPDGRQIYVFGYTDDPNGPAKVPGPTITVNQGDTVNLTLVNDKDPTRNAQNPDGDGHTIHLHGLDLPSAFDGDPMTMPGDQAVMNGQSYTYHFVANYAGTYYYHCHQNVTEHLQMGMYGAIIVMPKNASNQAYANTPTFDKQYSFVLSEFDSQEHATDYQAIRGNGAEANWGDYKPNYFLINGKAWPDTLTDPTTNISATVKQKVLIRLINAGNIPHSIHTHGFHFQVIGSDGRALPAPYQIKDTILIGPGERYDLLLTFDQVGRYMLHDHIDQNDTNDGKYPGGMMTLMNINNADGSNPVPPIQMQPDPAMLKMAVTSFNSILDKANTALSQNNLAEVKQGYADFAAAWDKNETIIQMANRLSYRAIEDDLTNWKIALAQNPLDTIKLSQIIADMKTQLGKATSS